jgi:ferric-dicitrate binding protein FerR (iron transport regulator)
MSLPDDTVAGLLQKALRQPPLPEQSLARLRAAVEDERQAQLLHTRRTRTRRWAGLLAACLCVVVVLAWWTFGRTAAVVGLVDTQLAGGLLVTRPIPYTGAVSGQTTLRIGQSVTARANTAIQLTNGGSLRMQAGSALTFTSSGEIRLRSGAIYMDFDPARTQAKLAVRTPYGLVQHLGTQYEVALLPAQLRVRVREGTVQLQGPVTAMAEAGEELTVDANRALQRQSIPVFGAEWAWEESVAGNYEAEGRNVGQLLSWVARETGRRINFTNVRVEQLADSTILHGSIRGLGPDVALRAILATTSLAADLRDADIIVRSAAPESTPPP